MKKWQDGNLLAESLDARSAFGFSCTSSTSVPRLAH